MNNERKVAFQEKRIKRLEEQIRSFEQEHKALENENLQLKDKLLMKDKSINTLSQRINEISDIYSNELIELRKIKCEYVKLIQEVKKERKMYNGGIYKFLKYIKKDY